MGPTTITARYKLYEGFEGLAFDSSFIYNYNFITLRLAFHLSLSFVFVYFFVSNSFTHISPPFLSLFDVLTIDSFMGLSSLITSHFLFYFGEWQEHTYGHAHTMKCNTCSTAVCVCVSRVPPHYKS